jgi:hypothetical protein
MPVRSLSRTLKSTVAAGALALALPGAALAIPAQPDPGDAVAAQPAPVPQQAPTWPKNPQVLTPPSSTTASADAGFQWDDAGIGAGGALVVVLAGFGGALVIRRRQVADPPLPA